MSPQTSPQDARAPHPHRPRRARRLLAGAAVASLAAGGIVLAGAPEAGAATTATPNAQSVGNFLDATLGGNTLDAIAKLKYATAEAPGSTSVQNPLDAELLNAIDLPLTGKLQLPSLLGIHLGAVTQKAYANVDGASFGQAGAVLDSGGASVGGQGSGSNLAGNATIDLSASGVLGSGASTTDALGDVTVNLGGVSADATTSKIDAHGKYATSTAYQIANLTITAGSPMLAQLTSALSGLNSALGTAAAGAAPAGCDVSSAGVPNSVSLDGGAVVLSLAKASVTIDVEALLKQLNLDLNNLPPNTDLIGYVVSYLTDPNGLAAGVTKLLNGLTGPLAACGNAFLNSVPALGPVLGKVIDALTAGQTTLESTVSGLLGQLQSAAGSDPLAPLAQSLEKLIDVGVNVQPGGPAGPSGHAYTDHLAATAKQGTAVVKGQTVVRALEVNVAAASGLGSLPGSASSTGLLTLGLANAAAGPSHAAAAASTAPAHGVSPEATSRAPGAVPTGVDAGSGTTGGTPVAPIVLLIAGLTLAGGGAIAWRLRGLGGGHTGA